MIRPAALSSTSFSASSVASYTVPTSSTITVVLLIPAATQAAAPAVTPMIPDNDSKSVFIASFTSSAMMVINLPSEPVAQALASSSASSIPSRTVTQSPTASTLGVVLPTRETATALPLDVAGTSSPGIGGDVSSKRGIVQPMPLVTPRPSVFPTTSVNGTGVTSTNRNKSQSVPLTFTGEAPIAIERLGSWCFGFGLLVWGMGMAY